MLRILSLDSGSYVVCKASKHWNIVGFAFNRKKLAEDGQLIILAAGEKSLAIQYDERILEGPCKHGLQHPRQGSSQEGHDAEQVRLEEHQLDFPMSQGVFLHCVLGRQFFYVTQSGRLVNVMMTKIHHAGKVYHFRAKRQMAQSLGQIAKFNRKYGFNSEENEGK
ncbi:hypothetical protein IFM89_015436 [Coptis chinensis]|uniref:Uncharacterized protein n=1 Tax=Coptis chinensis TaxID=261450 RepID=A0A835IYA9_9MAGN|nr:hypothetical protein IFM89_015436 [Coptis chinensis]